MRTWTAIVTRRVSQRMAALEWEALMLYPAHVPVKDIPIQPSVKVPAGWGIGTALQPVSGGAYPVPAAGSTTKFAATTVEQLQDSPILTGLYFHEYPLAPTIKPQHFLDVAADSPEDANLRPAVLAEVANLVREADALYASHHYNVYHFLLTLSDVAGGMGLEHGQSSDNGVGEKGFADDVHQLPESDLLSHEFTHSWNGKYRRPVGLYQPDFATPMQGALLWVYEGMTEYWGNVLAARSGLKNRAGVQGCAGDDGGGAGLHAGTRVAADGGYGGRRRAFCAAGIRRGRTGGAGRTTTSRAKCCGWMRTR